MPIKAGVFTLALSAALILSPLSALAEEQSEWMKQHKLRAAHGQVSIDAQRYSREHPAIAIFSTRGKHDDNADLTDAKMKEVINAVLTREFKKIGQPLPETRFFIVRGTNPGATGIRYFIGGKDVHVDLNGDGKNNYGESAYFLDVSVSPAVLDKIVSDYMDSVRKK